LAAFAQVAFAARHTSITLDEPLHIASGYACLVTGDYRLVEEHPPLVKLWQTLPLLWAEPRLPDPRTTSGWESSSLIAVAQEMIVPYRPIEPLVLAARIPNMLLLVLLAALVYRWAKDAFGPRAGLLALTLTAFDPNLLAHAGVAATDLGATCAIVAAMWSFWRWRYATHGPTWGAMLRAAVVLGLALGVKSTALLLLPVFGLLLILPPSVAPRREYLRQAAVACGVAFLVLWSLYRFEIGPAPGFPFPIPMPSHLLPLLRLRDHMQWGHAAFLMGKNYHTGDWRYFPVAFALKTPPLTLGLLTFTVLRGVWQIGEKAKKRESEKADRRIGGSANLLLSPSPVYRLPSTVYPPLLLFPALYIAASLTSSLNIGYRHLLPILPFIHVLVSSIVQSPKSKVPSPKSKFQSHVSRFTFHALLLGYISVTLWLFPWHLAYFNIFAGGPDGGYRYLVDSNLDWGQTWKALKRYLDAEGITDFGLSQYTLNDPRAYGLDYTPLPPWPDAPAVLPQRFAPAPGVYAISTTQLQGVVIADPEMFDYFRRIEPRARIGHAMHVYEIAPRPAAAWVAQCTVPVTPLTAEMLAEGLGRDDLTTYYFDCSQSWLIPPGNGWYVIAQAATPVDAVQRARLAYAQTQPGYAPPFGVYEWFGVSAPTDLTTTPVTVAPSAAPPAQGATLTPPLALGDTLTFLGYRLESGKVKAGQTLIVQTAWQVNELPTQPLSLMAHLLNAEGVPVAVGDGLGVPLDQWRAGQIIIQRHTLALPPETPAGTYWIQTGAYTFPDLQRLPILQNGASVGDRILAGSVEVSAP